MANTWRISADTIKKIYDALSELTDEITELRDEWSNKPERWHETDKSADVENMLDMLDDWKDNWDSLDTEV